MVLIRPHGKRTDATNASPLLAIQSVGDDLFPVSQDRADQGHMLPGIARLMIRHYWLSHAMFPNVWVHKPLTN